MSNDELRKLAEAQFARDPRNVKPNDSNLCWAYFDAVTPAKIIELLDVIEAQRKLLEMARDSSYRLLAFLWGHGATTDDGCFTDDPLERQGREALDEITNHLRHQEGEKK